MFKRSIDNHNFQYEFKVYNKKVKDYYCALTALYPENSNQGFSSASFISSLGDECTVNDRELIFEQYIRMPDRERNKIFEGDIILDQCNLDLGLYDSYIIDHSTIWIVKSLDEFLHWTIYHFCEQWCVYPPRDYEKSIYDFYKETRSKDLLIIGNTNMGINDKYKKYQKLYDRTYGKEAK